jgi:CheY-like chemotaxis protein
MSDGRPSILVVDDERPIRRFLSASLSGQYDIKEAASGEDAIRAVQTSSSWTSACPTWMASKSRDGCANGRRRPSLLFRFGSRKTTRWRH